MNLTDIKSTQTARQFSNSIENTFGVKVDISKLDLDKSAKLLLSVNEQIQKQRLSEDRHKLHITKSYLAKIFIKENLEKHITELEEAIKIAYKDKKWDKIAAAADKKDDEASAFDDGTADNEPIPGQGGSSMGGFGAGRKKKVTEGHGNEDYRFDPKGMTALRMLVGAKDMARAKRAIEMAKRGRAVPANFMAAFIPLIDILDDIMRSGMANVQMLKNLDKRAKRGLGIDKNESVEQVSTKLRGLYESQEDQAELLLASKDVVDRVQKAVDDLSKLRNEDLPPLLDAMRDEVGAEISTAYSNIAIPTLDALVEASGAARETLAQASRILTGEEQVPQAMGAEVPVEEVPAEVPAEEFETADAAAGEPVEAGRAERE